MDIHTKTYTRDTRGYCFLDGRLGSGWVGSAVRYWVTYRVGVGYRVGYRLRCRLSGRIRLRSARLVRQGWGRGAPGACWFLRRLRGEGAFDRRLRNFDVHVVFASAFNAKPYS